MPNNKLTCMPLPAVPISANIPQTLAQLPPKWAHMALGVENFLQKDLNLNLKNKKMLLAVSGGADSVSLLLLMLALKRRNALTIRVCHLNHGLRPGAAAEALWVKELCEKLELPVYICKVDIAQKAEQEGKKEGQGLENAGRVARYEFFEKVRAEERLDYVLTAHNLNDLAEDVIMRMIRGCGWPELGGMPAFDPCRNLLRPLLLTPRKQLEQMLFACNMPFLQDESNNDPKYTRNRVRKTILPLFIKENAGFLEHVRNLWHLGRLDEEFWSAKVEAKFTEVTYMPDNSADSPTDNPMGTPDNSAEESRCKSLTQDKETKPSTPHLVLPFSVLQNITKAERLRIYKSYLHRLAALCPKNPMFFTAAQIFELDEAFFRRKNGTGSGFMHIQFAGGAVACVKKKHILLYLEEK